MAAVWPVVTVLMAHHVYHSIEAADESGNLEADRDMSRFAA